MGRELIAEQQSLLNEYNQIKRRALEIRDRIKQIHAEIKTTIEPIPAITAIEKVCAYCGSKDYYARGYCRSCYSRVSRNGTPEPMPRRIKPQKSKTKRELWLETPWEDRLYRAAFGEDRPDEEEKPADCKEGIYYALSTLTTREETIILLRYRDGLTLEETRGKVGAKLSKEGIRQIEKKALRKLLNPSRKGYIQYGLERQKEIEAERERERKEVIQRENEALERKREALLNNETSMDFPIEEFGLSVRAYNCLGRARFKTRRDIMEYVARNDWDAGCLFKIRSCGRKTVEEIIEKLHIPYERAVEP